jgi:hypothetical protein
MLAQLIAMLRKEIRDELVAPLERRLKTLEERPELRYGGVWAESSEPYYPGTLCTDKGALWLCVRASSARPGTNDAWRLIVKAGQALRDCCARSERAMLQAFMREPAH